MITKIIMIVLCTAIFDDVEPAEEFCGKTPGWLKYIVVGWLRKNCTYEVQQWECFDPNGVHMGTVTSSVDRPCNLKAFTEGAKKHKPTF